MQASPKSLAELLTSAVRFVIPKYQRPYCWTGEEVEQLWNDLTEAWQSYVDRPDQPEDYFLGPVVVAKRTEGVGGTRADIVDGQQRITTLHALLWCAMPRLEGEATTMRRRLERLLLMPDDAPSLSVAQADQANFLALRERTPLDETSALGLTGTFLRAQLAAWPDGDALSRFLQFALDRTRFVLVETESYSSAWDLFIGLNGKGRALNPADLIKAYVCGTSTDEAAMADIWSDKVLPLEQDATSALLDICRIATGDVGSEAKLFRAFERAWNEKKITAPLLSDGARLYGMLWHTAEKEIPELPEKGRRNVRGLRELDRRDHTPVLLALGARHGAHAIFRLPLLRALEAYQLAMAVRSKRGRERDFTRLAASLYEQTTSEREAHAQVAELLRRLAPGESDVREAVRLAAYPGRHMKFIIRQYEEGMRGDVQVGAVQYEHLMPQTGTDFWYGVAGTWDKNEYARIVNNIGNVAPLDALTNIAGSNDDWGTKTALYNQHVPNWLVAGIANQNLDGWTPETMRKRADEIADWAVTTRWNLSASLDALAADASSTNKH